MRMTVRRLEAMREAGTPIVALTCYEASFARLLNDCGVDILLVGDSLGMAVQGRDSTLGVSVADVAYHTRCVAGIGGPALVMADLPLAAIRSRRSRPSSRLRSSWRLARRWSSLRVAR